MKSKHLLSALLGTTLIFAACGNDAANKTEEKAKTETQTKENQKSADTKSTESKESTSKDTTTKDSTSEVKASADLISKAKDAGKDIKSYHSSLSATMESDGSKKDVKMELNSDKNNNKRIDNNTENQETTLYLFDNKIVANQDGKQFIDVTKVMGNEVNKQIDQVDYSSYVKSLEIFKNAPFKKTNDGYTITLTYKNLDDYKEIAKQAGSNELVKSIEKQLQSIKGTETIYLDKNYYVKSAKRNVEMKVKDRTIKSLTSITYDNFNKVKDIEIPNEVKNAKSFEDFQKEMQQKAQNGSSSEATTEAK
ncbi:DUF6612 family protein [Macrococcus capreoli]|uniref:DUF6612 family protein n=1 Tax=Macrococcus capreoli TaxID=2982690 RepID=UPI0021D57B31|nr:DUF6612 family protein [Macrococcus sp. TMW 2.2395]MCU7558212.1 hypothetical protein [Macrococcus sp. TMW 2.2395]